MPKCLSGNISERKLAFSGCEQSLVPEGDLSRWRLRRLKNPMISRSGFRTDTQILRPRWATTPDATFVAELDGEVVGNITGMDWGSVFVLGPLTVHPDHWGQGIARLLIPPLLGQADTMGRNLTGLFTLPQSP